MKKPRIRMKNEIWEDNSKALDSIIKILYLICFIMFLSIFTILSIAESFNLIATVGIGGNVILIILLTLIIVSYNRRKKDGKE